MLAAAGRGLQGPAHLRDYLPATLLNDSGRNSIGLDLWMSHVIVWVFRELNLVHPAISVHTAIDDKMGAAGSAVMKIALPHAATIGVAVGVTIGIILIMSCCCYFCCRSLLALA